MTGAEARMRVGQRRYRLTGVGAFFSSGKDEARHERGLGIELSLWYPTPPPLLKTVGTFFF